MPMVLCSEALHPECYIVVRMLLLLAMAPYLNRALQIQQPAGTFIKLDNLPI